MVNWPEMMPPVMNTATQPSGEVAQSLPSDMDLVLSKGGVGVAASRIGAKEIDTSTDGTMNRMKPDGSPSVTMPCATTIPSMTTIM
jgi:hypothetical protein